MGISARTIEENRKGFRDWFTIDTLPKKMRKNENSIINLDISTGGGTHWVCYYNDPKYDFVEYFDPFGEYMSDDYELPHTHTPAEIEKYLKTSNKHLRYSSSFLQKPSSVKCGYYCMKYITQKEIKVNHQPELYIHLLKNPVIIMRISLVINEITLFGFKKFRKI